MPDHGRLEKHYWTLGKTAQQGAGGPGVQVAVPRLGQRDLEKLPGSPGKWRRPGPQASSRSPLALPFCGVDLMG